MFLSFEPSKRENPVTHHLPDYDGTLGSRDSCPAAWYRLNRARKVMFLSSKTDQTGKSRYPPPPDYHGTL
jgi:hypothetical protein